MKKLFEKNLFFRYISTFLGIIFVIALLLIIEKSIPNNRVKANIIKSETHYTNYYGNLFNDLDSFKTRHTMVDTPGDLSHLSILYLEDYKHPVKGFIEMNKDSQLSRKIIRGEGFNKIENDSDYSRYWHAHLLVLKPLLTFFNIDSIFMIYLIVLVITFVILLVNILKHSKLLAILFTIGSVMINIFFIANCDNFFYVFMITMFSSIILIKLYERKSKNIDLLFLVNGTLTACFDMLSCGTLPVTIPLFIYIYLNMLDNKKIKFRLILRYILLWLFGGALAYVVKWIILVIYYHGGFKEHVLEPMKVRIGSGDEKRLTVFTRSILEAPSYIYPYNLNILKCILFITGIISFIYLLFDKKKRTYYIYFFIICLIPFIRYLFLAEHSDYHNYFTYRCFLPVIMFIMLSIVFASKKLINKIKKT